MDKWREYKVALTIDYEALVAAHRAKFEKLLLQTLDIIEALNARVLTALQSDEKLDYKHLNSLATTFQRNSEVLLRLLGK